MTYNVVVSDVADMEATNIFLWILGRSPENAGKWQKGFQKATDSLAEFPERCPVAHENELFPFEVRVHLYGKYRILFTILDSDGDGVDETVRVLHVRHGAQDYLGS